jgi:hypothetical protein
MLDQLGVGSDLRDGHAGAAQPIHEAQPLHMAAVEAPLPRGIALHAGDQSLGVVPPDGVLVAAAAGADAESGKIGHAGGDSTASASAVSMYSVSARILPSAKSIT